METKAFLFFISVIVIAVGYIPFKLIVQIFFRNSDNREEE
jgi:hypothetical protein